MTSEPIRDPRDDHLLTPQNAARDHRFPAGASRVDQSMEQDVMIAGVVNPARMAKLYELPWC